MLIRNKALYTEKKINHQNVFVFYVFLFLLELFDIMSPLGVDNIMHICAYILTEKECFLTLVYNKSFEFFYHSIIVW